MRILATLQEPDAGSIRLGDLDVLTAEGRGTQDAGLPAAGVRRLPEGERGELLDHFALLKGIAERRRAARS
jgi:hypothetical protein